MRDMIYESLFCDMDCIIPKLLDISNSVRK